LLSSLLKKEAEIASCRDEAAAWVGELTDRDVAMYALALYAGEGGKTEGALISPTPARC
jgi:hypothetical protein